MDRAKSPGRLVTALAATVLVLFMAASMWAAIDDYQLRDTLPKGATVTGVPVGGLTRAAAATIIEEQVKGPLFTPVTVTFRGQSTTVDPSMFVSVDVDAAVADAAAPRTATSLPQRILWRITGTAYGHETTDVVRVDTERVTTWVKAEKKRTSVPAVDATVSVDGSKLKIRPAQTGVSFEATPAAAALSEALLAGTKTITLAETTISPKISNKKLGKTIFVSRSRATLTLYNGAKIEKRYRCAVGQPQFPTPLGWWKIVGKVKMPSWHNNGSDWAKNMPDVIGPGPGNPLGTRALYLNAAGIRIHGVPPSEDPSIGSAASHGCMRMHRWDVEDLYPRVPVGTRVIIVS